MYSLECDEPHYVRSTYNEEMEQLSRSIDTGDVLDACERFYWITSDDREEVLAVDDFMHGEKVITRLQNGAYEGAVERLIRDQAMRTKSSTTDS
jgi:exonuclease VII large subunit